MLTAIKEQLQKQRQALQVKEKQIKKDKRATEEKETSTAGQNLVNCPT